MHRIGGSSVGHEGELRLKGSDSQSGKATNRQSQMGQSLISRVTQLRTVGVHCREFAGPGPVVLKVVPVTGAAFPGHHTS